MSYVLMLFFMLFAAALGRADGMHRRVRGPDGETRRATRLYAWLVFLPILALAVTRSNYFGDTYQYLRDYRSIPGDLAGKWRYLQGHTKDPGFYALSALVSVLAGAHFRYFFLAVALIQSGCLVHTYRQYSEDYWLSVFVFVATTDYLSWMFNGIRQFTAVAITFAAAGAIFERKTVRACLIILLASLFHQSALMMLPVVFLVQGRPWNWKTLLVMLGTGLIMAKSGAFTDALDRALTDTQYSDVVGEWTRWGDNGTHPLRVLVYAVPALLSLPCRRQIARSGDRAIRVACNMSILTAALYLVSMVTSGIYLGRLPIYCSLYANGILLPWELKRAYGRPVRLLAIAGYVLLYFFQLRVGWGIL